MDEFGLSRTRKPSITGPSLTRQTSTSVPSKIRPIDIPQSGPANKASDRSDRDQMQHRSPSDTVLIREPPNIERARQPYTAKPGNGKVYTETLDVPNTTRTGRAYSTGRGPRDHEPEPEYRPRHVRTHSNASSSRPSGTRGTQSPPIRNYGKQPDPITLDIGATYPSEKYSSPPKQSSLSPPSSYTTAKYISSSSETRDRDRDRYTESRRSERRNDQPRSRRNTINNPSQLPPEIITPRNTEHWEQKYENRNKSRERDRERKFEPKSAGPVLHQEIRPDARPALSDSPDEEWYLRAPALLTRGGEYEVGKGQKYYDRR